MRIILKVLIFGLISNVSTLAQAVEYNCNVEKKFSSNYTYSLPELEKGQFSVKIVDEGESAILSRCSFVLSANKVTCDSYKVDSVFFDVNAKIKKYHVFRSHFDVQVFSNLHFVENNGRGGIAFGKCVVTAP